MKARIIVVSITLLCGLGVANALGTSSDAPDQTTAPRAYVDNSGLDHSVTSCNSAFLTLDVGPSLAGLPLIHEEDVCSDPEPVRSQVAGGRVDPESLGRSRFALRVYGKCEATTETGCAPPLQIQSWPACERSAADYTFGAPERRLEPTEVVDVRGVPGRFYGNDRLEISTGAVTVVIFGDSRELVLTAADALRSAPGSPDKVDSSGELPAPVRGAQDGTLPC